MMQVVWENFLKCIISVSFNVVFVYSVQTMEKANSRFRIALMTTMMVLTLGFALYTIRTGKKEKELKIEQYHKKFESSSDDKQ